MITVVTERKTGEIMTFEARSIEHVEHTGSLSKVKIEFVNGEEDTIDLSMFKVGILPRTQP